MLVTGASSGIGRAIALACAAAGADLALTYRTRREQAAEVAEKIRAMGRRAELLGADVSRAEDIDALARGLRDAYGRVDVWINNAGEDILTGEARTLTPVEQLDRLLAADLRGTILASWAAVELMRAQGIGGTIINVSWDHVTVGRAGPLAQVFAAAKGGIYSFSRSLARTVAPDIRVNVLGPGWIETAYAVGLDDATKRRLVETTPLGRWGTPEEVAHAAVYLASDDAAYVTGQMLMVNGGAVMM